MKSQRESCQCILKRFANPRLQGIGLGLVINEDGDFSVDPKIFSCCQGLGSHFDSSKQVVTHCQLKKRLTRINNLMATFRRYWGEELRFPVGLGSSEDWNRVFARVSAVVKGFEAQGQMMSGKKR